MRARVLLSVVALTLSGAAGCGSPDDPPPNTAKAGALPLWEGHAQQVFDDNIDAAALGLTMESASPRADRFLRERAQTAEIVARVRVQTVTSESVGQNTSYRLGLQVGMPQLRKPKIADLTLELMIRPTNPSFSMVKQFDAGLRGRTFIGFFHRFVGPDGEPIVHFHLSPDTAEVAAAVKEAVALAEISGS